MSNTATPTSSSSPIPIFDMTTSVAASTAASSSPPSEFGTSTAASELGDILDLDMKDAEEEEEKLPAEEQQIIEKRLARLNFVLEKSAVYSSILKARMDEDKAKRIAAAAAEAKAKANGKGRSRASNGRKRIRIESDDEADNEGQAKKNEEEETPIFQQPKSITGAKLKNYQLEGLQWMVSLDQNGISGILADEMGLGKTLQTIAFSAYLREHKNSKPFLVVCPLSVLHNWIDEYAKFAPSIPVVMYHGPPEHRAELRRTVMAPRRGTGGKVPVRRASNKSGKGKSKAKGKAKPKSKGKPAPKRQAPTQQQRSQPEPTRRGPARKGRFTHVNHGDGEEKDELDVIHIDVDEGPGVASSSNSSIAGSRKRGRPDDADEGEDEYEDEEEVEVLDADTPDDMFPVVITTYEIIIRDRAQLAAYDWGYIVVDEGHRLKNLNCKLMQEIKKYPSAGRMILTGTPLHNNLAELWSLLNFILPDIFNDLETFQEWFNLPSLQSALGLSRSTQIVSSLHAILKPFLLRRLKSDVETNLPPKKEYVLYAPLTVRQREAYNWVVDGRVRAYLLGQEDREGDKPEPEPAQDVIEISDDEEKEEGEQPLRVSKRRGRRPRKSYAVDGDDDEYFEMLERGDLDERGVKEAEKQDELLEIARNYARKAHTKKVNNMRLQNTVMQLRKVCSHPFLFDWPVDPTTHQPVLNDELVDASGKMMVLDRLLQELFKRGHKVLLFSQFTTMLDIIEDWATEFMHWPICRIDGSTAPMDRREEMNRFQNGGDSPDAPRLFLLSTRAGGLGINLVAADTVIFYDQDWNPQMDAQAQDRAHRIGQTRPVLIFRLVSAHTIETKIMQRATEKRQLEALVIAKGKFRAPAAASSSTKPGAGKAETMAEMAASLLRLEGEKIEVVPNTAEGKRGVLSDEDLETLLDRRPEVFADRGVGWNSEADKSAKGLVRNEDKDKDKESLKKEVGFGGKKAAFAVYEAPKDEGNDLLSKM